MLQLKVSPLLHQSIYNVFRIYGWPELRISAAIQYGQQSLWHIFSILMQFEILLELRKHFVNGGDNWLENVLSFTLFILLNDQNRLTFIIVTQSMNKVTYRMSCYCQRLNHVTQNSGYDIWRNKKTISQRQIGDKSQSMFIWISWICRLKKFWCTKTLQNKYLFKNYFEKTTTN